MTPPGKTSELITKQTRQIEIALTLTHDPDKDVEMVIPIDESIRTRRRVHTELAALSIALPVSPVEKGWKVLFPRNVLQLLSRENETTRYTGTLVAEADDEIGGYHPRLQLPLELVIDRRAAPSIHAHRVRRSHAPHQIPISPPTTHRSAG